MPFDPTLPGDNDEVTAPQLRSQFTGLDDKIAAMPGVTGAQVDSTNTGPPGSSAGASVSLSAGTLHFQFVVPQGPVGEVSQSQLSNDLSNVANFAIGQGMSVSSANSNAVQTLDNTMMNGETEALRVKLNELIQALRR